jgi:hypothetical protein
MEIKIPTQISFTEANERIHYIRNLNLEESSIDEIKNLLKPLWPGYKISAPILRPGTRFYRAVVLKSDEIQPKRVSRISYPSPVHIKKYQRANRIASPRFYCSAHRPTTLSEIDVSPGNYIVISRWDLREPLFAPNIGYTNRVFEKYNSQRTEKDIWWLRQDNSKVNQLIHDFFSDAFSEKVSNGQEYKYKISIAISEGLFGDPMLSSMLLENIKNPPTEFRLGILIYPSLSRFANTDNAVLIPDFVDKYLDLKFIEYIRVGDDLNISLLDFANSASKEGIIEWKGRLPEWSGPENAIFSIENGETVVRNANGELIIKLSIEDGEAIARNAKGEIVDPN